VRAVLTNFGSTGSVYPFLALGRELQRHGHHAIVALSPFFRDWVEHFDLEFAPIGPDLRSIQHVINEAMLDLPDSEEAIRALFAPLMPALPAVFGDLWRVCQQADVLISGPWQVASLMIHELTRLPLVTVQNSHFGGGGTPEFQRASASLINPFRARFGLPPLMHPLTTDANSPQLVLYNMSRDVRPPAANWPAHFHMPGYLLLDDESWQPDAALNDFVAAAPPVVITFGSMSHADPAALTDLVLAALQAVGCRAVVQQGWSGLAARAAPANVFVADFVPHDWLFPRASCVVHHGGAGTAASVFRAGVPSVFVPHAFDHPLWAALARSAGCAGPPIPYLELTAERLAAALDDTLSDRRYRDAAAALGRRVRAEHGLARARTLIEALVDQARSRPGNGERHEDRPTVAAGRQRHFERRLAAKKQDVVS
jgi:sterol 3beta-glucosyltransferase